MALTDHQQARLKLIKESLEAAGCGNRALALDKNIELVKLATQRAAPDVRAVAAATIENLQAQINELEQENAA